MLNEVKKLTDIDISSDTWWKNKNVYPIKMFRPIYDNSDDVIVTVTGIKNNNWAIESDGSSYGHICSYDVFREDLIKEFSTGQGIAFGNSDDQGHETLAKLFDTAEEFVKEWNEEYDTQYDAEDTVRIFIYHNNDGYSMTLKRIDKVGCTYIGSTFACEF